MKMVAARHDMLFNILDIGKTLPQGIIVCKIAFVSADEANRTLDSPENSLYLRFRKSDQLWLHQARIRRPTITPFNLFQSPRHQSLRSAEADLPNTRCADLCGHFNAGI